MLKMRSFIVIPRLDYKERGKRREEVRSLAEIYFYYRN
jgi:hypothetical protein